MKENPKYSEHPEVNTYHPCLTVRKVQQSTLPPAFLTHCFSFLKKKKKRMFIKLIKNTVLIDQRHQGGEQPGNHNNCERSGKQPGITKLEILGFSTIACVLITLTE